MFGFRKKLGAWSDSQALEKLETFLRFIRSASDHEAAMAFLATSMAASFAKQTTAIKRPFPSDVLSGMLLARSREEIADLSFYILDLIEVQKTLASARNGKAEFVASGFVVLQHSIKAVQLPEKLLAPGREIWRELMRGLGWIDRVMKGGEDQDFEAFFTDITRGGDPEEFFFVPRMLVPDWEGLERWSIARSGS